MKKAKKGGTIALVAISSILLVGAVVTDVLTLSTFEKSIEKVFVNKSTDLFDKDEAFDNGIAVAEELASEGQVLLENDGVLPMTSANKKINVLGVRSEDPVWGGSGSGGMIYTEPKVELIDALKEEGFEPNETLANAYKELKTASAGGFSASFANHEVAATQELANTLGQNFFYTGDLAFDKLAEYSDTALVILSRAGGEGSDLPRSLTEVEGTNAVDQNKHYLELNEAEKSLIEQAKTTFKKVIVVINSSNAMELGFLESENPSPEATGDIDAAVWIGGPGHVGFKALAKILNGKVNPSGRLTDTYPYEVEATPALANFGSFTYTNSGQCFPNYDNHPAYFINYQEGIYVGYRYFETAESFTYTTFEGETRNAQSYEDTVQYPFGYGLSYTTFDYEVTAEKGEDTSFGKDEIFTFNVKVTNTGDVAGKTSFGLYYSAPYSTDSKIQKSAISLGDFVKTSLLQPGSSETVSVSIEAEDMASYDDLKYYTSTGSYVLEEGEYTLSIRDNVHHALDSFDYILNDTIVYQDSNAGTKDGVDYVGKRTSDNVVAINRFDDARGDDFEYATRENGYATETPSDKEATAEQLEIFANAMDLGDYENPDDVAPEWGVKLDEPITLFDVQGWDYDDPDWEAFLSQLSLDDLDGFLATNGWGSSAVESIEKAQTVDMDGPSGINYVFESFMGTCSYDTVSYPSPVVIASTWNKDLATKFGDAISKEGQAWGVSGWYAPGANIHRTPFDGRNFEYYSEDPVLSGIMCANSVAAVQENGMYAYIKHFVLNETETNRHYGLCTWFNEQSLREIYAVPFEMAVKDGKSRAIMSSYNNLGTTWAGCSRALLQEMLRDEWGFLGTVLTDNLEDHGFMNIEKAILNGGTSLLCNGMFSSQSIDQLKETATGQLALREAAHQYLYTIANSFVPGMKIQTAPWKVIVISISTVVYVLAAAGYVWAIIRILGNKKLEKEEIAD